MPAASSFASLLKENAGCGRIAADECMNTVKTNAKIMLHERGYRDMNQLEDDSILHGFNSSRGSADAYVVFLQASKVTIKILRDIVEVGKENFSNSHVILVTIFGSTANRQRLAASSSTSILSFSFLTYQFLMTCVTHHMLVPKHELVPDCEASVIASSLLAEKSKFPALLASDPVAVFLGFNVGDLVRINRMSLGGLSQGGIVYRHVVSN